MLKGKTPLLIALILASLAGFLVCRTMQYHEDLVKKDWELEPVVVADKDINEGTELTSDMVAKRPMPKKFITPSVIKPQQVEKVVGQKLVAPLQRGDLVLWSHFRSSSASEHLSNIVKKVGRAVSFDITGAQAVGGWVRPNDHIDILGSFQDPKTNETVTVTLLQNVIVLATGVITGTTNIQALEKTERHYSNITVMVLPEEAEILVLAAKLGTLHISLRNPEDIGGEEERGKATIETLLTGERVKALKKQRERTIQIIRLPTERGGE